MPKGPRGEKRPADAIGAAVLVGKIATGEAEDTRDDSVKTDHRSKGGKLGGRARALALTPEQRQDIAQAAAAARWKKRD